MPIKCLATWPKLRAPLTMLLFITICLLLPAKSLAQDTPVPTNRPERLVEYSERQGAIVHVGSFRPSSISQREERQKELRQLIRSTFAALKSTGHTAPAPTKIAKPTKRPRSTRRPTRRPTPKPTPKPIDFTREPNGEGKIKCPNESCNFWNDLMETTCRFCGDELRTSPKILKAREERLAQAEEAERLRKLNEAMYAKPTPEPTKAPEPKGPTYAHFGKEIEQLTTPYKNMATNKLVRAGAQALADLDLALREGAPNTKSAVRKVLPKLFSPENGQAFAQSLRSKGKREAAMITLHGAGYAAANFLFAELEADQQSSANSVIKLIGLLGDKALPLVEARLTPDYVRIYPRLGDALLAIGKPSLSLLTRYLCESDDPYLIELASATLARFKEVAADQLLMTLAGEGRLDRKKRVIETMGKVQSAQTIDAIAAFVNNGRYELNLTSRQALCDIGTERALMTVGELLESGSQKLTESTLDFICKSKGPTVRVFGALVKDKNSRTRIWAIRGLAKLAPKHPEVRPLIESAKEDKNRSVRREAEKALSSL